MPSSFLLVAVVALCSMTFEVMSPRSLFDPRASNLRASENLSVNGFRASVTTQSKKKMSRVTAGEIFDYATVAVVMSLGALRCPEFFLFWLSGRG